MDVADAVDVVDEQGGNGGDDDEPPTSRRRPSGPLYGPPQFAIRSDGAMMMAASDHAFDRDLTGREVWLCFVLTAEEADLARHEIDTAEHHAASRIAMALPRKS